MKRSTLLLPVLLITLLAGCAHDERTGRTYSADEARYAQSVEIGEIVALRVVEIEEDKSNVGAIAGGAAGAAGGSAIGGGSGRTIAIVGGAILGGLLGDRVEDATRRRDALQVTVKTDEGKTFAVVQDIDEETNLAVGQRVQVLTGRGGIKRVQPIGPMPENLPSKEEIEAQQKSEGEGA